MYSGSTFTSLSGILLGAHQKIDRLARVRLERLCPKASFPRISVILHFEGDNGPDAIKRKSPAKDEPWHYIQPFDPDDRQLLELIAGHYHQLVESLRARDEVRSAFEASWLAHAIVDGLTPAHHYPYEEKLVELSAGQSIEERTSIKRKLVLPGETPRHQLSNNWKMWGPKGLLTTHAGFEWGVAVLILGMRAQRRKTKPSAEKLAAFQAEPLEQWFRRTAQEVAGMHLYDDFYRTSWTIPLARKVRRELAPVLIEAVTLVWYRAVQDAKAQPAKAIKTAKSVKKTAQKPTTTAKKPAATKKPATPKKGAK